MPEKIEARELPIQDIFGDKYRFEIPEYQRPYAWTTDQSGDLLDDLLHATQGLRSDEPVSDEAIRAAPPYFMGSIVVIKKEGSIPLSQVVDGQQRITTLTIMLGVLRELAPIEFKNDLHGFIGVEANRATGRKGHYRLTVRDRDRCFFQNNIQAKGALGKFVEGKHTGLSDSRRRMFENAKHLWDTLSELDDAQRDTLARFIVQRCFLVLVSTSDQESAYRIFAVMNDRGLDLAPTDILKAQIIGPLDKRDRSKYTRTWEDTEERVGRDDFREIFSHIRMIYDKAKLRQTLQQDFQEKVLKDLNGKQFIDEILNPYADAYVAITANPKESYETSTPTGKMNELLRHLDRLDNFDWIPPAMAYFKKYSDSPSADDILLDFTRDLERLAYALFLMRANVNDRINRYAAVLYAIAADDDLKTDSSPLQLRQEEKREVVDALNGQIYDQSRVSLVGKPLLLRLDNALMEKGTGVAYIPHDVTIEHVLPRNPAQNSEWTANFTEDQRLEWTGKLANLVPLSRRKNSGASNYDFNRKKSEYFLKDGVTPFALTSWVSGKTEWTPSVLECRQEELIAKLKEVWRLD